ncbi:hypothetical protein [Erwinia mallotivora]|uniref:hypothetical protein n=1 Tax=Erwinia mallotivora TaxID=69222 RepID=UPI0021C173FE|nr:hypothetical protein [Erwinia mallotivora]
MKIVAIVGASLLVTSFHAAAFVSSSSAPSALQVNTDTNSYDAHAIPSETVARGITHLVPVSGCSCPFCSQLRAQM